MEPDRDGTVVVLRMQEEVASDARHGGIRTKPDMA
jgi:hypothetical protein